ncbi:YqaJ viral recombinase family protein [Exiguobacterium aestuarii]|uniref:YqaJ viral recombinase family nuclease n=1 Tax=Exiguobacterium aestuarii TaxID=273527 RepID=UPI001CD5D3D6|nr:YqaJ viral recombinase family protein [Exiguobacterium aestuarii]MCA0980206.1 YqaJ viral recombinase family protein [Exiguobacterium aestuarii]
MNPQLKMNAIPIADTKDMSREEWLELRRNGIGGSDIAGILGLNKYKSPMGVYLDKVGESPHEDETSEAAYWGNMLEEVVAQEFGTRTGLEVGNDTRMLSHPDYPFLIANLDRVVVGKPEIIECKTSSAYRAKEWEGEQVPMEYLIQVMHYLAVTGYERAHIAVLIGGQRFVHKTVERDNELIELMIDAASNFWNNHVLTKVPPPFDGSNASVTLIGAMFPQAENESETELPDEAEALIEQYREATERMDAAKTDKLDAENKLKALIGNAEIGIGRNHIVEWKNVKARETVDARQLLIDHPDIVEKYRKVGNPTRRFSIKEVK